MRTDVPAGTRPAARGGVRLRDAGSEQRVLCGWGRAQRVAAGIVRPPGGASAEEVAALLAAGGRRGSIPRGLGRSYGDAAQRAGGRVVDLTGLDRVLEIDEAGATVRAQGGVSIDALLGALVPRGLFVPVTPGTRHVTLGGAIAADIHGKNHHRDGSIGSHVRSLVLASPRGVHRLGPGDGAGADLYWATVGGLGLTGAVVEATLGLIPIETSRMVVDVERAGDLDEVCEKMSSGDDAYRYSVAWVDALARGARLGRSVLTRANHATQSDLPAPIGAEPLAYGPGAGTRLPPGVPGGLLNRLTVRAFNEAWWRKTPRSATYIEPIPAYFHPLDRLAGWNRLYGPRGFVQYQLVIPFGEEATLRRCMEALAGSGTPSFLAVLKRFGAGDAGPLSFPMPGWTLALDMPVGAVGLAPMLDGLDEQVAAAGGRVYLAKDARLAPGVLATMYPRLPEWRRARDEADPDGVLASDLSRRLGLTGRDAR